MIFFENDVLGFFLVVSTLSQIEWGIVIMNGLMCLTARPAACIGVSFIHSVTTTRPATTLTSKPITICENGRNNSQNNNKMWCSTSSVKLVNEPAAVRRLPLRASETGLSLPTATFWTYDNQKSIKLRAVWMAPRNLRERQQKQQHHRLRIISGFNGHGWWWWSALGRRSSSRRRRVISKKKGSRSVRTVD